MTRVRVPRDGVSNILEKKSLILGRIEDHLGKMGHPLVAPDIYIWNDATFLRNTVTVNPKDRAASAKRTSRNLNSIKEDVLDPLMPSPEPPVSSQVVNDTHVIENDNARVDSLLLQLAVHLQSFALDQLNRREYVSSGLRGNDSSSVLQSTVLSLLEAFIDASPVLQRLRLPENSNPAQCLRTLLYCVESGEIAGGVASDSIAMTHLRNAIYQSLSSLTQNERFADATERAARRAIYQFAYGLTHEINNPLANIAARAQQLAMSAKTEADKRSLGTIVDQSMRAHEMLAEMMRVVQPPTMRLSNQDVVEIVRNVFTSLQPEATRRMVRFEGQLPNVSLFCDVDMVALNEALRSAAQNALDVCRPSDSVKWICEHLPSHQEERAMQAKNYRSGQDRIRIALHDTGPGMSPECLARAWDLYFSGREHGRGLGISLANIRRIIESHQGIVWLQSAPNAGCNLEIRLPYSPPSLEMRRSLVI